MYGDYLELLPRYCGVPDLAGVTCVRPMHGFVPNWHEPLQPLTARLLHVGDAAGNRSALSFAGEDFFQLQTVLLLPACWASDCMHAGPAMHTGMHRWHCSEQIQGMCARGVKQQT